MISQKLLTIGAMLALTLPSISLADKWPAPRARVFAQAQGEYALKVLPDGDGIFYTLDERGDERVLWRTKLINVPVYAIVCENGKHVVTRDTWAHVGYEHCLVVYGERGQVIVDFNLEDLLTADEIASIPASAGSRSWSDRDITEFDDHSRRDEFVIRMKHKGWTKALRVTLSTGKLAMRYSEESTWEPVERIAAVDRLRELGAKVSLSEGAVRDVDLTNSHLSDADLEAISRLTSLERLTLNGCPNLTDAGLVHVRNLAKLTTLTLERTMITDAGLESVKGLSELNILSLNWTRTSDAGLKHLEGLVNLGVLYLCETDVGDLGLASLKRMENLQWLDLRGTKLTDAGLKHLSNFPRLRLLCLHGVRMTDVGVAAVSELTSLEILTLAQTQVTDSGLGPLAKIPKLIDVDLGGTQVTLAGLAKFQQALPNCRVRISAAPQAID